MTAWRKWRPRRPAGQAADPAPEQEVPAAAGPPPADQEGEGLEDEGPGDDQDEEVEEESGEPRRSWWSTSAPRQPDAPEPQTWTVSPGVQLTINQPPQAPPAPPGTSERVLRARRWLLRHGAAAGVGWLFGLYQSMTALLDSPDRGGAAAGLGLAGAGWLFAEIVTDRLARFLPVRLRPAIHWTARIPFATALLVTALHAPNAVL